VVREQLATLLHSNLIYFTRLPTEQARFEGLAQLVKQQGLKLPSFDYNSRSTASDTSATAGCVKSSEVAVQRQDLCILLQQLAAYRELPEGLFSTAGCSSTLSDPLPGLHTTSPTAGGGSGGNGVEMKMIPLTKVKVEVEVGLWVAEVPVVQEFLNKGDTALEVTYYFPKEPAAVVTSLCVSLYGRTLAGKCLAMEEAQGRYDDAVASGKAAVLMEEHERSHLISMNVGNLPAHKVACCEVHYTIPATVDAPTTSCSIRRSYFRLPTTIAPLFFCDEADATTKKSSDGAVVATSTPKSVPYSLEVEVKGDSTVKQLTCLSHRTDDNRKGKLSYVEKEEGQPPALP